MEQLPKRLDNTISPDGVYKLVRRYALALGLKISMILSFLFKPYLDSFCCHDRPNARSRRPTSSE
jgi:hypothetical protein